MIVVAVLQKTETRGRLTKSTCLRFLAEIYFSAEISESSVYRVGRHTMMYVQVYVGRRPGIRCYALVDIHVYVAYFGGCQINLENLKFSFIPFLPRFHDSFRRHGRTDVAKRISNRV